MRILFSIVLLLVCSTVYSNQTSERLAELEKSLAEGSFDYLQRGKWQIDCKKDNFTNVKSCHMFQYDSDLMVSLINGQPSIFIGGNHFPQSKSALKIDNNGSFFGLEGSISSSQAALNQLKSGKIAHTRYQKWPHQLNIDRETNLEDFKEKYNKMLEEYKKL